MTEETKVLIEELKKYLATAPDTFFTENHGRILTKDKITSFLYLHCLEDDAFDNYSLIQVCQPRLVGYVLDEALSSLARIEGDTDIGEDFFEFGLAESAVAATTLSIKFGLRYALRAIWNELHFGKDKRWVNVRKERAQMIQMLEEAQKPLRP